MGPLNGNHTSAVHGTDPNKVTHKCWLYEHVPTNFQSTDNKVAAHASGGSHYTCFAKTTSAPVTLDPTSPSPISPAITATTHTQCTRAPVTTTTTTATTSRPLPLLRARVPSAVEVAAQPVRMSADSSSVPDLVTAA